MFVHRTFLASFLVAAFALTACGGGSTFVAPTGNGLAPGATGASPAPGTSPTPAAGASGTPSTLSAAAIPFPAATDPDPFYAQPSPFPNVAHGTILATRTVTYAADNVATNLTAYEIKFASRDMAGHPIAAMETLALPNSPASPLPLLVHAFPEDSLGAQCSPTHFTTGSQADSNNGNNNSIPTYALNIGWAVVWPDHEGPYGLYAVGAQEGYIVLDGATAAVNFAPGGLNAKTPIGMDGYSGGAQAVEWAGVMQNSYAPNLNVVGIASGGTPADMASIFEGMDGTSPSNTLANQLFFSIIFMGAIGINRGFPQFFSPILNAAGIGAATKMENGCLGDNSDGSTGPTGHFSNYDTVSDLSQAPGFIAGATADSQPKPGMFPKANYFLYHSVTDELIPVEGVDKLYAAWCADGSTIAFYRDHSGGDHDTMDTVGENAVEQYFTERFVGLPVIYPASTMTCNQ